MKHIWRLLTAIYVFYLFSFKLFNKFIKRNLKTYTSIKEFVIKNNMTEV